MAKTNHSLGHIRNKYLLEIDLDGEDYGTSFEGIQRKNIVSWLSE